MRKRTLALAAVLWVGCAAGSNRSPDGSAPGDAAIESEIDGSVVRTDAARSDGGLSDDGSTSISDAGPTCDADPSAPSDVVGFIALPSDVSVFLSWAPPADRAYAGVLVLRSTAPIVDCPIDGVSYEPGTSLGGSSVVAFGDMSQRLDTPVDNGTTFYYRVFAYATGFHYAAGVSDSATPRVPVGPFTDVSITLPAEPWGIDIQPDGRRGYGLIATTGVWGGRGIAYFSRCNSDCTHGSGWSTPVRLGETSSSRVAKLAFDAAGTARVVLAAPAGGAIYRTCSAGCTAEANWSSVSLPDAGTPDAMGIDAAGRVWIAGAKSPLALSYCTTGCSSAANWTTFGVATDASRLADLQLAPGGAAAVLYYHWSGSDFELHLASCASECTSAAAWSDTEVTSTDGSTPFAAYRFVPGGGARLLCDNSDDYWSYLACDTCAPAMPAPVYRFTSEQVWLVEGFAVTSKGQPRVLTGQGIQACDYGCDLAARWVPAIVGTSGVADMHAVEGDRFVVAYARQNVVVVSVP